MPVLEARNAIIDWGKPVQVGPKSYVPLVMPSIMLLLSWVTIALRLYTRTYLIYAFGWDDVFMIIALCCFTVYSAAVINIVAIDGLLDHMPWPELISAAKSLFLALVFYVATVTFLKISLGVFLLRIINLKSHKILVYVVMTVSTVWGCVAMMVAIFQCGYPSSAAYFLLRRFAGTCISGSTAIGIAYTQAVVSACSDVVFVTLPLFILRGAQINKRAKYVLGGILVMGGIGSVASLVRFVYVRDLGYVDTQFLFKLGNLSIWSTLECGLGISAGSLATLRPMFRKILQGTKYLTTKNSRNSTHPKRATAEPYTMGSSTLYSSRATESKAHSFVQRFSWRRKSTHSGKRLSGDAVNDPETTGQWGFAMPMQSISEKPARGLQQFVEEAVDEDLDADTNVEDAESFVGITALPRMPKRHSAEQHHEQHHDPPHHYRDGPSDGWPIDDEHQSVDQVGPHGDHGVLESSRWSSSEPQRGSHSSNSSPSTIPERSGEQQQQPWI